MKDPHSIEGEPFHRGSPQEPQGEKKRWAWFQSRPSEPPLGLHVTLPSCGVDPCSSIYDEPNTFAGRDGQAITREWRCSNCGYDLQGLKTGDRCPECGEIEVYYPPPNEVPSYGQWLSARIAATPRWAGYLWCLVAVLGAAVPALYGAVTSAPMMASVNPWFPITWGAFVDEILKIAFLTWLVETRPFLARSGTLWVAAAALTGALWGVVENLVLFQAFLNGPSFNVVVYRWTVGVAAQAGCSLVAGLGLARTWENAIRDARPPRMASAFPCLGAAIALHATYNALVCALDRGDFLL